MPARGWPPGGSHVFHRRRVIGHEDIRFRLLDRDNWRWIGQKGLQPGDELRLRKGINVIGVWNDDDGEVCHLGGHQIHVVLERIQVPDENQGRHLVGL